MKDFAAACTFEMNMAFAVYTAYDLIDGFASFSRVKLFYQVFGQKFGNQTIYSASAGRAYARRVVGHFFANLVYGKGLITVFFKKSYQFFFLLCLVCGHDFHLRK